MASRRRVAWTSEARRTLEEVIEFVAQESPDGARRVLGQALDAAGSLETLAERGRVVPELGESAIREVFVYRYRLISRWRGQTGMQSAKRRLPGPVPVAAAQPITV